LLTRNPKTELKEEKILESVREIAFFLVHKDRVSETVDRSDGVARHNVASLDCPPEPRLDGRLAAYRF
jgi:hypothetical protein